MEKFGHRPSADTELTPTPPYRISRRFSFAATDNKSYDRKNNGSFSDEAFDARFCCGLTDSDSEAFHRRQLTKGDVTSPQALKIYDQRKKIRE
jgi:hypothetical protein